MHDRRHDSRTEVLRVLGARLALTPLDGGGFRAERVGIFGVGTTRRAAAADWWQNFSEAIARPKPASAGDEETVIDEPSEGAPPA